MPKRLDIKSILIIGADDAVAEGFDSRRARGVGFGGVGVLAAVEFDDQSRGAAGDRKSVV